MKIAFEGYHACKSNMSGVGRYANNIIKSVLKADTQDTFEINAFNFLKNEKCSERMSDILNKYDNICLKECAFMHYGLLARHQSIHKIFPYNLFFKSFADIYHFFGFTIPERIKGKTITTVHDMNYKLYPGTLSKANFDILSKNLQRSCDDADIIVAVSNNVKKEIAEHMNVSLDKIQVVYNAVDHAAFFPRQFDEAKKLLLTKYNINCNYIFYLGTLEPRKNITTLIKAFKTVADKNKGLRLIIAGQRGWKYKEVYKTIDELRLADKIIFMGYVDDEDIPALYSCAEIFVFPSLYEGFGIPPLEAMACGAPVIVSNTSSLPEVVGDAGIYVDPNNVENLAYEIDRLISSDSLKKQYSEKGLIQAGKFSWEDSAKKVLGIYRMLS